MAAKDQELNALDKTLNDAIKTELEKSATSEDTKIRLACLSLAMKWRKCLQESSAAGMGSAIGEEEEEELDDNDIEEILNGKE